MMLLWSTRTKYLLHQLSYEYNKRRWEHHGYKSTQLFLQKMRLLLPQRCSPFTRGHQPPYRRPSSLQSLTGTLKSGGALKRQR